MKPFSTVGRYSVKKASCPEVLAVVGLMRGSLHLQGVFVGGSDDRFWLGVPCSWQQGGTIFLSERLDDGDKAWANLSGNAQNPGPAAIESARYMSKPVRNMDAASENVGPTENWFFLWLSCLHICRGNSKAKGIFASFIVRHLLEKPLPSRALCVPWRRHLPLSFVSLQACVPQPHTHFSDPAHVTPIKKAGVLEYLVEEFGHVGLLVDEPPAIAGLPFV